MRTQHKKKTLTLQHEPRPHRRGRHGSSNSSRAVHLFLPLGLLASFLDKLALGGDEPGHVRAIACAHKWLQIVHGGDAATAELRTALAVERAHLIRTERGVVHGDLGT